MGEYAGVDSNKRAASTIPSQSTDVEPNLPAVGEVALFKEMMRGNAVLGTQDGGQVPTQSGKTGLPVMGMQPTAVLPVPLASGKVEGATQAGNRPDSGNTSSLSQSGNSLPYTPSIGKSPVSPIASQSTDAEPNFPTGGGVVLIGDLMQASAFFAMQNSGQQPAQNSETGRLTIQSQATVALPTPFFSGEVNSAFQAGYRSEPPLTNQLLLPLRGDSSGQVPATQDDSAAMAFLDLQTKGQSRMPLNSFADSDESTRLGGRPDLMAGSMAQYGMGVSLPLTDPGAAGLTLPGVPHADDVASLLQHFCSNVYLADAKNPQSAHMMFDLAGVLPGSAVEMARDGVFLNVRLFAADEAVLRMMRGSGDRLQTALDKSTGLIVRLEVVQRTDAPGRES